MGFYRKYVLIQNQILVNRLINLAFTIQSGRGALGRNFRQFLQNGMFPFLERKNGRGSSLGGYK